MSVAIKKNRDINPRNIVWLRNAFTRMVKAITIPLPIVPVRPSVSTRHLTRVTSVYAAYTCHLNRLFLPRRRRGTACVVSLSLAKNDDRLCFWTRDELQLPRRSLQTASRIILAGKLANALSLSLLIFIFFFFTKTRVYPNRGNETVDQRGSTRPGRFGHVREKRKKRKKGERERKGSVIPLKISSSPLNRKFTTNMGGTLLCWFFSAEYVRNRSFLILPV